MISSPIRSDFQDAVNDFAIPADPAQVERAASALEANGFRVLRARDADDAKRIVLDLIPNGAEVHHGASETLQMTGITDEIEKSGLYDAVRPRLWSMDRQTQGEAIRRMSASPSFMLASVHAITESGSLIVASNSGSQLGPIVSGAGHVILVVGTQKIVPDLEAGIRRLEEYTLQREDARMQAAYGINSAIRKLLIINSESQPGRITVVLVDEVLGF